MEKQGKSTQQNTLLPNGNDSQLDRTIREVNWLAASQEIQNTKKQLTSKPIQQKLIHRK